MEGYNVKGVSYDGAGFVPESEVPAGPREDWGTGYSVEEGGKVSYYLIKPCGERVQYLYAYHEVAGPNGYHWEEMRVYDLTDDPTGNYCGPGVSSPAPTPSLSPLPLNFIVSLIDPEGAKVVFDGQNNVSAEVQAVNPVLAVQVPDYEDGQDYDWAQRVDFQFAERTDGITPQVDTSKKFYDPQSHTVYYPIPFTKEALLYLGDQWIEVTVNDPKNGSIKRRIPVTIGHKTVFSGIPGLTNAYRVLSDSSTAVTQVPQGQPVQVDLPAEYQNQGATIPVEANDFFSGTSDLPPDQWVAPVQTAFIIAPAAPAGAQLIINGATILFGTTVIIADQKYDKPKDAAQDATNVHVKTHVGKVKLSSEVWSSLAEEKSKSTSITRALATECLQAMKARDGSEYEYWTKADRNAVSGFGIFHKRGLLFYGNISGATTEDLKMNTFKVPGFLRAPSELWPSNPDTFQAQWGDVVRNIMRFRPDYDSGRRSIWGHNWAPTYRYHYSGDIREPHKPYKFGTDNLYRVDDNKTNHAIPNGAVIVAEPPKFRGPNYLTSHFNNHFTEFRERTPKGAPAVYLYNTVNDYEAGAQEMLKSEFHGQKDYYIRSKDLPGADGGSRGDVVLFRGKDDALAVWSYDGYIRTYHVLRAGKKEFASRKRVEEFNFY